jgi:hypothetical protein
VGDDKAEAIAFHAVVRQRALARSVVENRGYVAALGRRSAVRPRMFGSGAI